MFERVAIAARTAAADAAAEVHSGWLGGAWWVWWRVVAPVLAVVGVVVAVVFGRQLTGLALGIPWIRDVPILLPWLVGAAAAAPAVLAGVKRLFAAASASGEQLQQQLHSRKEHNAKTVTRLEDELTRLEPARQLGALLTEISGTDRYDKHRGLLGRVSGDLWRLNEQLVKQQVHPDKRWRIILYIDDLDRCPADRVVEVLQAVNLLMGMELFFVVVAVDPRWLFAALDQHHRHLLTHTGPNGGAESLATQRALAGRALDYLDKIFQIPYALRPVGSRGEAFLRDLLPPARSPAPQPDPAPAPVLPGMDSHVPGPAVSPTTEPSPHGGSGPAEAGDGTTGPAAADQTPTARPHAADPGAPSETAGTTPAAARSGSSSAEVPERASPADTAEGVPAPTEGTPVDAEPVALPPASQRAEPMSMSPGEVAFLPRLAQLLPTPRAMKKFSNLYRLLRISLPPAQLPAFEGDPATGGEYQAAALLLAILISDPGHTHDLHDQLHDADPNSDIHLALHRNPGSGLRAAATLTSPAVRRLAAAVTNLRAAGVAVHGRTGTYQRWARAVARYSLETYQLYTDEHTDGPPDPTPGATPPSPTR